MNNLLANNNNWQRYVIFANYIFLIFLNIRIKDNVDGIMQIFR